jgi:trans-2,3-dihydro-3-hydroxyanthranilate isomerase
MVQPRPRIEPFPAAPALLAALGVARSALPVELYVNGPRHVFVALDDPAAVAALSPDLAAVARVTDAGVNCFAGGGRRWKTRMFAPGHGVAEDPATGSAAGPLACHLARHGRIAFGDTIEIAQGAEINRPSTLHARVTGAAPDRFETVEVGGAAVVVARGEFRLP